MKEGSKGLMRDAWLGRNLARDMWKFPKKERDPWSVNLAVHVTRDLSCKNIWCSELVNYLSHFVEITNFP